MRKMHIHKLSALLLSLVLLFSLVACGEQEPVVDEGSGSEIVQQDPVQDPVKEEDKTEEKTETPADKAEETKPAGKEDNAGSAASSTGKSEKVSAEVTPEAPAEEETPAAESKEETPAAKEEVKEEQKKEEEVSSDVEAPAVSGEDLASSETVPVVNVTEVSSEAELLSAMKEAKVSEIKVTQNISVSETIAVSGKKTVTGAKITAGKAVAVMYDVPAGASLVIKESVIDGAGKAGMLVKSAGAVSISNAEIKNFTDAALYNAEGGLMALNYVTVSGCKSTETSGGAVKNYGDLAVKNSIFTGNSTEKNGGAIFSGSGAVTKVEGSTFAKNTSAKSAGAMWLNGEVYIADCTFTDNSSKSSGAAVYCNYNVTGLVVNSKFTGNCATGTGAQGGGIYVARTELERGQVRVENCHFEDNYAFQYGGGINSRGYMTVINSTFINNRSDEHAGALNGEQGSTYTIAGCTFRGNSALDCGGAIRNNGDMVLTKCVFTENNAEGDGGGGFYSTAFGGQTLTDCQFINNTASTGFGGGAYIYGSNNYAPGALLENCVFTGNTSKTHGGAMYNMGWLETRNCKFDKNSAGSAAGAIYNQKGNLKMYDTTVTNNTGNEHGGAIRNQGGLGLLKNCYFGKNYDKKSGGVAYFNTTSETKVIGCTFEDNEAGLNAGALYLYGNTSDGLSKNTIENCKFINNTAKNYGGAIRNHGVLTIRNCELDDNQSGLRGGAIYCNSLGQMNMVGCTLTKNTSDSDGAAMAFGGYTETEGSGVSTETNDGSTSEFAGMTSQVNIVNTLIKDNHTTDDWGRGGAFYNSGNVAVSNVRFEGNYAGYTGGAIHSNGLLKVEDSVFVDCHSNPDKVVLYSRDGSERLYCRGGAIYMTNRKGNTVEIDGCTFDGCSTYEYGGAIALNGNVAGSEATIRNSDFIGNEAVWRGGAISSSALTTIENCSFIDNHTTERQGGAIFNYDAVKTADLIGQPDATIHAAGRMSIDRCDFSGNVSATDGGAIHNGSANGGVGEITVSNTTITGNAAGGYGGGISSVGPVFIGNGNTIHSNTPEDGDIYISSADEASLTVKGSGNSIGSVRLGAGKTIIASSSANLGGTKIYTDSNVAEGDAFIEGSGSGALGGDVSSGDGRYEVDPGTGNLVGAKHDVTLPAGVTGNATATYGTDYSFTVSGGNVDVSVTVNGTKVPTTASGNTYTINGEFVTGDVVITVTEVTAPSDIDAASEAYILDGAATKVQGTLAEVLAAAEAGDTVYVCKDASLASSVTLDKAIALTTVSGTPATVTLAADATITVTADVMFQAKDDAALVITGAEAERTTAAFAAVGSSAKLGFGENVTVKGMNNQAKHADGWVNSKGGAISATEKATITVSGATFSANTAGMGGAVYLASGGSMTMTSGLFDGNIAAGALNSGTGNGNFGGAIYAGDAASLTVLGGTFSNNQSERYGGAIAMRNSSAKIENITMSNNQGSHGVLYTLSDGTFVSLANITAENNRGTSRAGFFYIGGGKVVINGNIQLTNCYKGSSGSEEEGIFLYEGALSLRGALDLGFTSVRYNADSDKAYTIDLAGPITAYGTAEKAMTISATNAQYVSRQLLTGTKGDINASVPYIKLADASYLFNQTNGTYDGKLALDPTPYKVGEVGFEVFADAVAYANGLSERATITIAKNVEATEAVNYTIAPNVDFNITNDTVISGPVTFDGENATRAWPLFTVNGSLTLKDGVTIKNMVSTGTSGGGYGAAIRVQTGKKVDLTNVSFYNNVNARGAVYVNNGYAKLNVTDCYFEGNGANLNGGGAIYGYSGSGNPCTVTITGTTFKNNTSTTNGGAVLFTGVNGVHTIENCVFENNTAVAVGGAVQNASGAVTITGCSFTGNKGADAAANDVNIAGGVFNLDGGTTMSAVSLASGTSITLGSEFASLGTDPIVIDGAAGTVVLTGVGVDTQYAKFTGTKAGITVTPEGVLYSDVTIATIGSTEYKSLASALEAANAAIAEGDVTIVLLENDEITSEMTVGGDNKLTIKLADGDTSGKTISLGTTGYLHLKNAEVLGNASADLVIDCGGAGRATHAIETLGETLFKDVTIQNLVRTVGASSRNYGAALRVSGTCILDDSTIQDCEGEVGAAYIRSNFHLILRNGSEIKNVKALYSDYAPIHLNAASSCLTVSDSAFTNNSGLRASAITAIGYNSKHDGEGIKITNTTFTNNVATTGGAIHMRNDSTVLILTGCTFTGSAPYDVNFAEGTSLTVDGSTTMSKVFLAGGKSIALGESFASAGTEKIVIDGTPGEVVLTGVDVDVNYTAFTGVDVNTTVESDGTLKSITPVAKIGDTPYTSFSEALAAAETALAEGDVTIILLDDVSISAATSLGGDNKLTIKIADDDTAGKTVDLGLTGRININGDVEFLGNANADITLDLGGAGRADQMHATSVTEGNTLTIKNGVVKNYNVTSSKTSYGAAFRLEKKNSASTGGILVLEDVTVEDNNGGIGVAYAAGGAVINATNVIFRNNVSSNTDSRGGIIHMNTAACEATFTNCQFLNNEGGYRSGVLDAIGTVVIDGCTFSGNGGDAEAMIHVRTASTTVDITNSVFSGNTNSKTINVAAGTVTVDGQPYTDGDLEKAASSIEITTLPTKLTYTEGDALDVAGGKITVTYSDTSTSEVAMTADMVSGYNNAVVGTQELTVTYAGCTDTYSVTVEAALQAIAKIGDQPYATLAAALAAANEQLATADVTVVLVDNATINTATTAGGANKLTLKLDAADTTGKTVTIDAGAALNISGAVEVVGNSATAQITFDGNDVSSSHTSGIEVTDGSELSMQYVTVQKFNLTGSNAAPIQVKGPSGGSGATLKLDNVTIQNNSAVYGAIRAERNGDLTVKNTDILSNTATSSDTVYFGYASCEATFEGCEFKDNTAKKRGTAISAIGKVDITDCVFTNNDGTGDALGVVHVRTSSTVVNITGCTFTENNLTAIYTAAGTVNKSNCTENGAALSAVEEETVVETAPVEESVKTTVDVLESTVAPAEPEAEETPVIEEVPAVEETPVVEEIPAVEETPVVEEAPTVEETPVVEEVPTVEETPAVEEAPIVPETPAAAEAPKAEEPAAEAAVAA